MSASAVSDEFMARALVLAERGRGTTRPNPMVGCVIVADGEVVGEGWHHRAGGPHAEVVALTAAGDRARGATAYVTLEPCNHHGRTGPCTQALLEAGIGRVVYAVEDPGEQAGGGAIRLAEAGVDVEGGVLADWVRAQNEVFLRVAEFGLPFVTLKLAQSLDGALTVRGQRWITGEAARRAVHVHRARSDAVLVGVGTVLADNPRLDARDVPTPAGQPRPVVFDTQGRTPEDAAVAREGTIIVTHTASKDWVAAMRRRGVEVVAVPAHAGRLDVGAALQALVGRDLQSVLAEPGPTLAASLVRSGHVNRLMLHVAVGLVGPSGLPRTAPCVTVGNTDWRTRRCGFLGDDLEVVAVPAERT